MLSADQWRQFAEEARKDVLPSHVGPKAEDCREVAALIEAAQKVLDGLNRRIQEAPAAATPVFEGIVALSDALLPQTGEAADGTAKKLKGEG